MYTRIFNGRQKGALLDDLITIDGNSFAHYELRCELCRSMRSGLLTNDLQVVYCTVRNSWIANAEGHIFGYPLSDLHKIITVTIYLAMVEIRHELWSFWNLLMHIFTLKISKEISFSNLCLYCILEVHREYNHDL